MIVGHQMDESLGEDLAVTHCEQIIELGVSILNADHDTDHLLDQGHGRFSRRFSLEL